MNRFLAQSGGRSDSEARSRSAGYMYTPRFDFTHRRVLVAPLPFEYDVSAE
jgi:hypothetical protein